MEQEKIRRVTEEQRGDVKKFIASRLSDKKVERDLGGNPWLRH